MRRLQRLIAASVLVALSGALAGCGSSVNSFDPMDWFDWIDTKKKVAGDRKPVFPDGVPGLEQGVPRSLYKGAQDQPDPNAQAVAAPPPPPPETKKNATRKSKQPAAATASTDPSAVPEEDTTAAAPPAPKKKIVRQRTTAPPADQSGDAQSGASQPQSTQQSAAPFPAPIPGGTFTR